MTTPPATQPTEAEVQALALDIEPVWWPEDQPRPASPSYSSTEIAHRVLALPAGFVDEHTLDGLLADIGDFIHLVSSHWVSGVCHGDNDGCEGGPTQFDCEQADAVWEYLDLDARQAPVDPASDGYRS